jgi:hypothetical protein
VRAPEGGVVIVIIVRGVARLVIVAISKRHLIIIIIIIIIIYCNHYNNNHNNNHNYNNDFKCGAHLREHRQRAHEPAVPERPLANVVGARLLAKDGPGHRLEILQSHVIADAVCPRGEPLRGAREGLL